MSMHSQGRLKLMVKPVLMWRRPAWSKMMHRLYGLKAALLTSPRRQLQNHPPLLKPVFLPTLAVWIWRIPPKRTRAKRVLVKRTLAKQSLTRQMAL